MTIAIEKESDDWANDVAEDCILCKCPTRYWHKPTNTPVCECCAIIYSDGNILAAKNLTKTSPGFFYRVH